MGDEYIPDSDSSISDSGDELTHFNNWSAPDIGEQSPDSDKYSVDER